MAAPNPAEARTLIGKSINLKFDNYLFINDTPFLPGPGLNNGSNNTLTTTIVAQFNGTPLSSPVNYTIKLNRVGDFVNMDILGQDRLGNGVGGTIQNVNGNIIPPIFVPAIASTVPLTYLIKCPVFDAGNTVEGWIELIFGAGSTTIMTLGRGFLPTGLTGGAGVEGLGSTMRAHVTYRIT